MERARKVILKLLLTALIAAGIYVGAASAIDFRVATDALDWPATQGVITRWDVMSRGRIELSYAYEVGGRQYRGHRMTLSDGRIRYKRSVRAQLYAKGDRVAVHYAPEQPSNSVLETGIFWPGVLFHACAALLLTTVGAGGLFLTSR